MNNLEKAGVLMQALPYIQEYSGETVVIKYGGNAMQSEELKQSVMGDLILLNQIGVKVVLVHGGGPEINDYLSKLNIKSEFIGGLRKTDENVIDIVQMVLCGKINKNLVNIIENKGGRALGLSGIDGHMIEAKVLDEKLGFVGDITAINTKPVTDALNLGYIPVVSTVGCDRDGHVYNINADTVAARLAGELEAKSLINMTDINGVMRDKADCASLMSTVHVSEVSTLIKEGIISGGMIPKANCCVDAIRRGVKKVFIINGTVPHAILIEILSDEGIGTMFIG